MCVCALCDSIWMCALFGFDNFGFLIFFIVFKEYSICQSFEWEIEGSAGGWGQIRKIDVEEWCRRQRRRRGNYNNDGQNDNWNNRINYQSNQKQDETITKWKNHTTQYSYSQIARKCAINIEVKLQHSKHELANAIRQTVELLENIFVYNLKVSFKRITINITYENRKDCGKKVRMENKQVKNVTYYMHVIHGTV